MSCNRRLLCALLIALGARASFAQVSTNLTVAKVQDFKQTSAAAPVQVTNPFSLTLSAQASYTIASATVAPPVGAVINLNSVGSTLFTFVSAPFATATALDAAFPNGAPGFKFTVNPPAGTPVSATVTPSATPYPAAPTLTNTEWQGPTGAPATLQFDPTLAFTITWTQASAIGATDGTLLVSDPFGAGVYSTGVTPGRFLVTIPANTLKAGTIYSARLSFGTTNSNTFSGITTRWTYISATNFALAPVNTTPVLISPKSVTTIVNQPAGYQLLANSAVNFNLGQSNPLPPGLNFDPISGIVYGTPTTAGSPSPDYQIQNAGGFNGGFINLTEQSPPNGPSFVNATTATGHTNEAFRFPIITNGATPAAKFSATGLPAGLTIDPKTGVISGMVASPISAAATITVVDGSFTRSCSLQLSFIGDPILPIITSARRVTLVPGEPLSYQITAAYGANRADEPSYNVLGTLPSGLTFNAKTGVISGTFTGAAMRDGSPPDERALNDTPPVQLVGTNAHGSGTAPLTFFTAPSGTVNLSTRMFVGTGAEVLIGGFIITGTGSESILLRGIGPSLPVGNALQDPVLELHDKTGAIVTTNDNWKDTQQSDIQATGIPPTDDRESAVVATFQPSSYTAIISGKNTTTGVGLVELYDLGSQSQDTAHGKLAQISTRGTVHTGDDVMIGGFIIQTLATKALLRGIGPELSAQGVTGALQDPMLELHDGTGTLIASNDNWQDDATQAQQIQATGVAPTDPRESALIATLNPGNYTAVLRGKNDTTGVALVEVYNLQ